MATINIKQDSKGQSIQIGGNIIFDSANPQQYEIAETQLKYWQSEAGRSYYRYDTSQTKQIIKNINKCSIEGCEHQCSMYLTMDNRETASKETIEEVKEGRFCLMHIEEATLWLLETVQKEVE